MLDEQGRDVSVDRDLHVMQSFRAPRATSNPYIHMLDEALSATPGLTHLRFSWRRALFGRVDVLHFHWPEIFLTGRTPVHRFVRRARFQALLWKLRATRGAMVRTVHNLELPSGVSAWDRRMLTRVRDGAAVSIALNPQTNVSARTVVILHGHYIDWFAKMERSTAHPGRVAFVGLVRRYKGLEVLFDAYEQLSADDSTVSLVVAGSPTSAEMAAEVRERAAGLPRTEVRLDYLSEQDYAREVTSAALVPLPYTHMHNSGSVLAALSLGRPVLVPDNEVNRALQDEVGPGWVHRFTGTLSASDIDAALRAGIPTTPPDLSRRGWREAGTDHLSAYRQASRHVRPAR